MKKTFISLIFIMAISFIVGCNNTPQPTLTGIEIKQTYKTEYSVGEKLDLDDLTVYAIYSDSSRKYLNDYEYTTDPPNGTVLNEIGITRVYVNYQGFSEYFKVKVTEEKPTITKIEIASLPVKTTFYVDEDIDTKGLRLEATYSDGTKSEAIRSGYTYSPKFFIEPGIQTVEVFYEGQKTSYKVTII